MFEPSKHLVLLIFLSSLIDITVGFGTCSTACVLCTYDTCMQCDIGNYLESGSCYTCPTHCTSCNNSYVCYNCTEGYHGLSCDKNCTSSLCLNNTCNKESGACLHGCFEGHFLSGSSCFPCSSGCKTCAKYNNNCLQCKEGYYGPSCQRQCSRCKGRICTRYNCTYGCGDRFFRGNEDCNECSKYCTSCSHYNNCQVCVDGYFGPACQFVCSDCSPCNQDGSCPKTTGQAPTRTTQLTSPSNESVMTTFSATTISTRASSHTSEESSSIQKNNNALIIYATAGGGGGLVVIVLVFVVIVSKRRLKAEQSDTVEESIDMTENENYISAEDIDERSRNSNNAQNEVKQNKQKYNDDLYSLPNKMHCPTMVTMETTCVQDTEDSPSNHSSTIPVKSNMHSDLI